MRWNWFQKNPAPQISQANRSDKLPELVARLNEKYGDFEYAKDARALDTEHKFDDALTALVEKVLPSVQGAGRPSVLIAGANSGAEIPFFKDFEITALDLSDTALGKISEKHPEVRVVHGDIQHLPFPDKSFDGYVSMRAIHASNLDTRQALEESVRVARSFVIYSISNGYNIEGGLVKGMYDYASQGIDPHLPEKYLATIQSFLAEKGYSAEVVEVPSEIIVFATAPQVG